MGKRKFIYCFVLMCMLLVASCRPDKTSLPGTESASLACILENDQTDYRLQPFVQVLADTTPGYTIQDILQPSVQNKFQAYSEYTGAIKNYQYYWGKLQLENRMADADAYTEWVLSFTGTWTTLDVFTEREDGSWRREQNGTFTPDPMKRFAPTARGNLVKLFLPPHKAVTVYFRGKSERTAIYPSFYLRLRHIETFYDDLLKSKVGNAFFMGFLLMMFSYNLIVYFFGKDRSFIFYSGYLIMVVIYAAYSSEDLVDWLGLFPDHPAYQGFIKLSLYLAMMCYLAFIRSFLDLGQLLPKWDTVFKAVIFLGVPLIVLDIIVLLLTNFSYVVEDRITVPYIILVVLICCSILYPLYRSKDKKGYFIIAGIMAISLGAALTVISRVWTPPFSIFYLKAGTIVEILIFSLGLAYRQRQQEQARQQADFKLKESQLIQEKKELEAGRLKELNDFKARFYTNITHEFRTPLTVITGIADTLTGHQQEKALIQRNSQNLLRLINQLLDLSKLESGTLSLNKVHQDIIVYLQYLTESFYSAATQKNIRLLFYSEEKAIMMDYDEEKIQQIVYNLLSNALKFTGEQGKIIFHASRIEEDGQPFLKLKVKDNGIGIAEADLPHIFNRFYSLPQPLQRRGEAKEGLPPSAAQHESFPPPSGEVPQAEGAFLRGGGEGAGIGLALAKELVELMNGRIEVQSRVGEGTEFTLYLPIEATVEPTAEVLVAEQDAVRRTGLLTPAGIDPAPPADASDEEEASYRSALPELLIIEDNPDIVTYIKTILKDKYKAHTAGNGALGIEKALEIIPDIIISDVMMPEKNGYEVCETLKQDERASHIPIILLTAKATQADKVEGLKYGADAFLTKPFDKEELLIRLEKLVESRRRLQQRYASGPSASSTAEPSIDDLFLQKLWAHIQDNLSDAEFGVPQLAAAIDMNQMQVYRKLKALTGKTPSQFIRSYRLQKGLELLQKGELNISEIAYDVGFTDPSYFSRVFQKEFGRSPSDFIK
ncbi:MAG: response regulator [Lewinellaceae bacterium]|nr:response regulator [Lewinellaceae bacterium]